MILLVAATLLASWGVTIGLGKLWRASFKEQGPIVEKTVVIPSPDRKWRATVETVDNGLGFGLGNIYNEVHLLAAGASIHDHGDRDSSVVFYIEAERSVNDFPTLQWLGPTRLLIEYPHLHQPGKSLRQFQGLTIEYRSRPAA